MSAHQQVRDGFERLGARVTIRRPNMEDRRRIQRPMAIDVVQQDADEQFDILIADRVSLAVVDVQRSQRHLVLSAWNSFGEDRFLCGHDEFHWFVAALPFDADATDVQSAKEALKPDSVKRLEDRKHRGKYRRKHDVYLRQGEWFFVPCPHAKIDRRHVKRRAILRRSEDSKPHYCSVLYEDGEREFACARYPKMAFFETEYRNILRTRRKAKQWKWRQLPFNPTIYVKGWLEHEDHSPLFLDVWHRVEKNREADGLSISRMIYRD